MENRSLLLRNILTKRVLLLDGAMGSLIQKVGLTEKDFKGSLFENHNNPLKGDNDVLVLTCPDVITDIHYRYLEAGCDIIETNTFNATTISQADYGLENHVYDINKAAAILARKAADKYSSEAKPRFVAGSIGPTNKTASMSPDVNNPGYRAVSFDDLETAYTEQIRGLLDGGADILLIETVFDSLNCKAALHAANAEISKRGLDFFPIMVSATVADKSGRTLSGQTIEAFINSIKHANLLSIGLNCSFGAHDMMPYLAELGQKASCFISAYPNAGLPNQFGQYDQTPDLMANQIKDFLAQRLVNVIGGCCGTTPEHIGAINQLLNGAQPHVPAKLEPLMRLSGLNPLTLVASGKFYNVGERTNVAGSRKFARLISEGNYEEALQIASAEVEAGAHIIDVNMDDAMLDAEKEMVTFLNMLAAEPDVAKLPIMIDSSKWDVIVAGLKCVQGKAIVNSISLKEGEEIFLSHAQTIKNHGAATVVMAFDEKGQADTFERRKEICGRAYRLLTDKVGFPPEDIIFDPNILAIATGIEEHNNYAVDFINTVKWIKDNLPYAKISGGVSNLSFSFRGNNTVREAMHCVFLHYATQVGMDMGIVNPATLMNYDEIPLELRSKIEDVVLNKTTDATEKLIDYAEKIKGQKSGVKHETTNVWRESSLEERLKYALAKGITEYIDADINEALTKYPVALDIIEKPLMDGMNYVGELFGAGKMFLPQVVKTARVMKHAVEILQPTIEAQKLADGKKSSKAGKILMVTVKGDVHDIGKNIVSVILACNNYEVIDLGVMVPCEKIIEEAVANNVDVIGLSGLITPSLEEMVNVAAALQQQGLNIPIMVGGATTSDIHTAVKIAPVYNSPVVHVKDASQSAYVANALINKNVQFLEKLRIEQQTLRDEHSGKQTAKLVPFEQACKNAPKYDWNINKPFVPNELGIIEVLDCPISEVEPLINWVYFFNAWKLSGKYDGIEFVGSTIGKDEWLNGFDAASREKAEEALKLYIDAHHALERMKAEHLTQLNAVVALLPANSDGNSVTIFADDLRYIDLDTLNFMRQQNVDGAENLSLADYVAPQNDFIGLFALTAGVGLKQHVDKFAADGDDYNALLYKLVADRLAEAFAEYLHFKVRTKYWGYSKEKFNPSELKRGHYQGVRPAIGYPSCPDHSLKANVFNLLRAEDRIGVTLTESFSMFPNASICGLYFSHPEAKYFAIDAIGDDQIANLAKQKGVSADDIKRWTGM